MIPWRQFYLLYGRLQPVWALDRLQDTQAVAQAVALCFSPENDRRARDSYDKLVREAFPKVKRDPAA